LEGTGFGKSVGKYEVNVQGERILQFLHSNQGMHMAIQAIFPTSK
jgi:hypothetical protein